MSKRSEGLSPTPHIPSPDTYTPEQRQALRDAMACPGQQFAWETTRSRFTPRQVQRERERIHKFVLSFLYPYFPRAYPEITEGLEKYRIVAHGEPEKGAFTMYIEAFPIVPLAAIAENALRLNKSRKN